MVLLLLLPLAPVALAPRLADRVHSLPGFPSPLPSAHYSGYIAVGPDSHRRQLHYWLQMSEGDPAKDPVVLWLNGGPCTGCATMCVTMDRSSHSIE